MAWEHRKISNRIHMTGVDCDVFLSICVYDELAIVLKYRKKQAKVTEKIKWWAGTKTNKIATYYLYICLNRSEPDSSIRVCKVEHLVADLKFHIFQYF